MGNQISEEYDSSNTKTTSQSSIPASQLQKVNSEKERSKYVVKEAFYNSRRLTEDEAGQVMDEAVYEYVSMDKFHEEYAPISGTVKTIVEKCEDVFKQQRSSKLYNSIIQVYNAFKINRKNGLTGSKAKIMELRLFCMRWLLKNIVKDQVEIKVSQQNKSFIYITFQFGNPPNKKRKVEKKGKFPGCMPRQKTKEMNRPTGYHILYHKKPSLIGNLVKMDKHIIFHQEGFCLGDLLNQINMLDVENSILISNSRVFSQNIWSLVMSQYKKQKPGTSPTKYKNLESPKLKKSTSLDPDSSLSLLWLGVEDHHNISIPKLSNSQSKSKLTSRSKISRMNSMNKF